MLTNFRTVSILLSSITNFNLGLLIHFNNTDNGLHQANIGITDIVYAMVHFVHRHAVS